ncbi:MAG: AEC family transporter [Gammaproteobacteria bacterium]|nr:AEC family transporter [Gammaproteobacteria bacterium]
MLTTINVLVPVFLVIGTGFLISRTDYLPKSVWPALDLLCWYVLFPLVIILSLSEADLSSVPVRELGGALVVSVALMILLLFALKPLLGRWIGMTGPEFTSFFQGTSRWNGFAALAIVQALHGEEGLVAGALSFAVMVPILQVVNVVVLSVYGQPADGPPRVFSFRALLNQLARNPMLVSCFIGICLNRLQWNLGETLITTMELISSSALGLALLAVGAGLKFNAVQRARWSIMLSSMLKLVVMPLLIASACRYLGVSGLPYEVAIVCGAAPTAGTAYIMARQMGGDTEMIAAIIAFQTAVGILTLPLMLYLLA